jgi:hypothetical protein
VTQPAASASRRTALVVFLAIAAGAVVVSAAIVALGRGRTPDRALASMAYLAPLLAAAAAGATLAIRQRMQERAMAAGSGDWWRGNLGTAIALWAICEAAVLFGAVAWFFTGAWPALAGAALGLLLLLVNAPRFLEPR